MVYITQILMDCPSTIDINKILCYINMYITNMIKKRNIFYKIKNNITGGKTYGSKRNGETGRTDK